MRSRVAVAAAILLPLCVTRVGRPQSPAPSTQAQDVTRSVEARDSNGGIDTLPPSVDARVRALIASAMSTGPIPGLSVAVVKRGAIVFVQGFGLADLEGKVPVTAATRFEIGSETKSFTALGVMRIYDNPALIRKAGITRLNLDAPLRTYLVDGPSVDPSFTLPPAWNSFTPRQLLAMASGIPDAASNILPWQSIITETALRPLLFPAGTNYCYSNPSFLLLGELIQQLTDTPYAQFMQEQIFAPFGMTASEIHSDTNPPNVALGYQWNSDRMTWNKPQYRSGLSSFSAGAMITSANDLALFLQQATTRVNLPATAYDLMWTPAPFYTPKGPTLWGLGWESSVSPAFRVYRKDGGLPGYTSQIFIDDLRGVAVAVSTNTSAPDGPEGQKSAVVEELAAEISSAVVGVGSLLNPPSPGLCYVPAAP